MATSLAKQLHKLQLPETKSLVGSERHVSFLFDKSTHLDRENLFAIGINGLEELECILPEFKMFRHTLFNESSMLFERSVQPSQVNNKLDSEITVFLRLLSPFFLLKPAHKALEWLIQRFQVHLYNADELVKCALPYHDTKVFVRVVQLLDLKQSAKNWNWLLNCQTSGSPLSKLTLINRCRSYVDFMAVVCQVAGDSAEIKVLLSKGFLRTVVLFYMSNVLGALEQENGVSEAQLTTLLPFLLSGLKSECRDYVAASYVIVSQLARKGNIVVDVWAPLLKTICLNAPEDLLNEALSCLAFVCESQKLDTLPENCCILLLKETMRSTVAEFSHHYLVFPLVRALLCYQFGTVFTLKNIKRSKTRNVCWFLQNVRLSNDEIKQLMGILLKIYLENAPHGNKSQQGETVEIMEDLEKRFSGDFDELLDGLVSALTDSASKREAQDLIKAFQLNPKVLSWESNRLLALHHPNVARRRLAVEEMAGSDCSDLDDESYWKLVEERLNDDYPTVVAAALKCKRLATCIGIDKLLVTLMGILEKNISNHEWEYVMELCIVIISQMDTKKVSEAMMHRLHLCLLPFLFPPQDRMSEAEMVLALDTPFFSAIKKEVASSKRLDEEELCNSMPSWVAAAIVKMPPDQKERLVEALMDESGCLAFAPRMFRKIYLLWLYGEIISAEETQILKVKFSCLVLGCAGKRQKKKSVRKGEISSEGLENLKASITFASSQRQDKKQLSALLFCLGNAISALKLPEEMSALGWFDVHESQCDLSKLLLMAHTEMFKILLYGSSSTNRSVASVAFSLLLNIWRNECFTKENDLLKFLIFLLTRDADVVKESVVVHIHVLQTIKAICSSTANVEQLLQVTNLIPGLLVSSTSMIDVVRSAALSCISVITNKIEGDVMYAGLLNKVASHKVEITEDGSLLQNLLSRYFQSEEMYCQKELESFLTLIVWNDKNGRHPLSHRMQNGLLLCLEEMDKPEVLLQLLPVLNGILETKNRTAEQHEIATNITCKFTPVTAKLFSTSPDNFTVFLNVLHDCGYSRLADFPSLQMTLLSRITKKFFAAIEKDFQQSLLQNLIDLQVDNNNHVAVHKLAKVLRKVMLDGKQIKIELQRTARPTTNVHLLKHVKRLKRKVEEDNISDELIRKRTTIILEALQGRQDVTHFKLLIPILFVVLKRCLEGGDLLTVEYDKQLVLSALYNCVSRMNADDPGFGQDQFNVELVVDCIRSSTSPKTHQEALFLLSLAAKIFPEHVVHNTMAIFTFMGQNVTRHDDSFSFGVILSTMEAIVPAVMERSRLKTDSDKTKVEAACSLTRVFVDALPDIPEHRRIPLFSCLVSALGHDQFLWCAVVLILEKLILFNKKAETAKNFERRPILEFAVQLSHCYVPLCQITTCEKLLSYTIDLKDVDEQKGAVSSCAKKVVPIEKSTAVLNVQHHAPKLRCHFKLLVTEYISTLLSSRPFLTQVMELQLKQTKFMRKSYRILLEKILMSAHRIARRMETSAESPLMKYWKVLQHRTYELLDKLSSLLPSSLFISVIDDLLKDSKTLVRRKALEILATKLQHPGQQMDPANDKTLSKLVPTLLKIVESNDFDEGLLVNGSGDSSVEISSNRQMALLTLKHICRILGATQPELFEQVLKVATDVVRDESIVDHVRASALLYMAEHCQSLKSQSIPHLALFVPALLAVLEDLDRVIRNELLLLSVVTALHKIVERVCQFLSPYIESIMENVCRLSTLSPENPKSPLVVRLATIRHNISVTVSPRILIPAVESCFCLFCEEHNESIQPLMQILREYVSNTDKEELDLWHGPLFNFFLVALDYRSNHQDDEERTLAIEGSIMEPMLATILKMSEATFRPFFIKLFDWGVRGDGPSDRVVTFYRVVDRIADQLKSLFVLFAGHLIRNAATLLDQNNSSKTGDSYFKDSEAHKSGILVRYILDSLHKCFLYDNERFVNKERFDILLQPLVDQIENDSSNYPSHICNHLAPCLSQLAVAAASDSLWKPLNHQVLLKTRHQAPKVRFGALQVLREIAKGIGGEYMLLIPETIPFLAELMEDENLEVEQLCQAVIVDLEGILGEPLQGYF